MLYMLDLLRLDIITKSRIAMLVALLQNSKNQYKNLNKYFDLNIRFSYMKCFVSSTVVRCEGLDVENNDNEETGCLRDWIYKRVFKTS